MLLTAWPSGCLWGQPAAWPCRWVIILFPWFRVRGLDLISRWKRDVTFFRGPVRNHWMRYKMGIFTYLFYSVYLIISHLPICLCLHLLDSLFLPLHLFMTALKRVCGEKWEHSIPWCFSWTVPTWWMNEWVNEWMSRPHPTPVPSLYLRNLSLATPNCTNSNNLLVCLAPPLGCWYFHNCFEF